MALSSTVTRKSYAGDGATTSFGTGFKFLQNSDVQVVLRDANGDETTWTLGTQYSLTGAGEDNGGTVTVDTSPTDYTPASGTTLVIIRSAPNTQPDTLPLGGPLPTTTVERMADRLTMLVQQLSEKIGRSILLPISSTLSGLAIPEPESLKVLRWNADADALENIAVGDLGQSFDVTIAPGDAGLPVRVNSAETGLEIDGALPVAGGGTGATTAAAARTALAVPGTGTVNAFTMTQTWARGAALDDDNIAAGILTLGTDGNSFNVGGTEALTGIATVGVGTTIRLVHTSARTLTHDATDLILPGGANITTAAGDVSVWEEYAAGDWRCTEYTAAAMASVPATQAEMEAGTAVNRPVTPGRQHFHPSAAKAWVFGSMTGTVNASYNVSSLTDVGTGKAGVNFSTAFSSVNYKAIPGIRYNSVIIPQVDNGGTISASRCDLLFVNGSSTAADPNNFFADFHGDQ